MAFDDLADSCLMTPSLSTVRIDADKIGAAVCALLKKAQQEKFSAHNTLLVPVELVIRASS